MTGSTPPKAWDKCHDMFIFNKYILINDLVNIENEIRKKQNQERKTLGRHKSVAMEINRIKAGTSLTPDLDNKRDEIIRKRAIECLKNIKSKIDVMCLAKLCGVHWVALRHATYDQYLTLNPDKRITMFRKSNISGWDVQLHNHRVFFTKIKEGI